MAVVCGTYCLYAFHHAEATGGLEKNKRDIQAMRYVANRITTKMPETLLNVLFQRDFPIKYDKRPSVEVCIYAN